MVPSAMGLETALAAVMGWVLVVGVAASFAAAARRAYGVSPLVAAPEEKAADRGYAAADDEAGDRRTRQRRAAMPA
jgi:hypothetical protein